MERPTGTLFIGEMIDAESGDRTGTPLLLESALTSSRVGRHSFLAADPWTVLTAKEKSEDFVKSIDKAIEKIERQLSKYKTKIRLKNRRTLRKVKEDSVSEEEEE